MRVAALVLIGLASACAHDAPDAVPNVRLGMAPRDVRDRFQPDGPDSGASGSWQTALGTADDTALLWTATDPRSTVTSAKFEFHNGMLVAIREVSKAHVTKQEIWTTPRTVTERAPADGGSTIVVLARDCPTHKDEAEGLAARAR